MDKPIFISHSSKDKEIANKICEALEENGLKCWIAPRDIRYGSAWAGEISRAISESSAFLFLSSGNSNYSNQVSREVQLAIENGITVIPIKLDDTQYSDVIKYYLATIHCMIEYDAAKTHKLVSDIVNMIDVGEEGKEDKKEEKVKKEKTPKKKNYVKSAALGTCNACFWAVLAVIALFFTGAGDIIKYTAAAICVLLAFVPVFLCRHKAFRHYSVNRTKINILSVAAVVGFAAILCGGYTLDGYLWYTDSENTYRATLSAPEEMTVGEYDAAVETVKERLDILMGDERYSVDVKGDKIELIASREAFADQSFEDCLKAFVTRAMRFYITTETYKEEWNNIPEFVEVTAEDIESISLKKGTVEGLDAEKYGIETEEYEYIEVILSEEYIKNNADAIKAYGDEIIFAQDKEELGNNYYYHYALQGENKKTFLILCDYPETNIGETIIYNLTHEPLSRSLYVDVKPAIVWETVKDNSNSGKNQKDTKELSGNTVTVCFKANSVIVSEGEWTDTLKAFKNRLDALGQDYSFGSVADKENVFAIRTSVERMGDSVMELLATDGFMVTAGYTSKYVGAYYGYGDPVLTLTEDENTVGITVKATGESEENTNKMLSDLAQEKLFLMTRSSNIPVLSMAADKNTDGKELVFDEVRLGYNRALDSETKWIAELVEAVYLNKPATFVSVDRYDFDFEGDEKDFGVKTGTEDIENAILSIYPEGEVSFEGSKISVKLHLPVDESLPDKVISTSKEIFDATDYENSDFSDLSIYMIDEDNDTNERCRVFFSKYYKSLYADSLEDHEDGYIYVCGIFSGGRLDRDSETFLKKVNSDEFFSKLNRSQDGAMFF